MCFDRVGTYNIVALTGNISHPNDCENINVYTHNGHYSADGTSLFDLMMADDDYLEKLERGEYHSIKEYTPCLYDASNDVWQQPHIIMGPEAPVWQEPHRIMTPEDTAKVTFLSPFDESYWRKMYAGMALQGLVASDKWRRMEMGDRVCVCVEMADALIEELKKEKE